MQGPDLRMVHWPLQPKSFPTEQPMTYFGEQRRAYQREWMRKRREEWLGIHGPCVECGSWEKLEVDHKNRSEKVTNSVWSWSLKRRDVELAKCQVLCKSCHLKKTIRENTTWQHGVGLKGYNKYKCRCDLCKKVKSNYMKQFRSRKAKPL